jgi:hypothetical protein
VSVCAVELTSHLMVLMLLQEFGNLLADTAGGLLGFSASGGRGTCEDAQLTLEEQREQGYTLLPGPVRTIAVNIVCAELSAPCSPSGCH